MATILAISSQVVRGTIGNSVATFALQRLGHTVWQIPTILLSNHPGYGHAAGRPTEADNIAALWNGLKSHGWTSDIDAILTGYMPTAAAAATTATIIQDARATNPLLKVLCDPVIGDEPKGRYVPLDAAEAIRDQLLPLADITTPNLYELSWLTDRTYILERPDVRLAAQQLPTPTVITTSVRGDAPERIENVLSAPAINSYCDTCLVDVAPKGTGDFFSALVLAHHLNGEDLPNAMARATSAVDVVVKASDESDVLEITRTQEAWTTAAPAKLRVMAG